MKNINERNNFVFEFRPVTELFEEGEASSREMCSCLRQRELHLCTAQRTG